jgi:hypothetical protein
MSQLGELIQQADQNHSSQGMEQFETGERYGDLRLRM